MKTGDCDLKWCGDNICEDWVIPHDREVNWQSRHFLGHRQENEHAKNKECLQDP